MEIQPSISATLMNQPVKLNSSNTGIAIEIQPGQNNVDGGDRSGNTAEISITTPDREASASLSREQAVNGLDARFQQQALSQISGGNPSINPRTLQALQQTEANSGELADVANLQQQRQLANTYQNVASGNTSQSNNNTANPASNGVNLYNNAIDAYVQQTLLFATADRARGSFSTTA